MPDLISVIVTTYEREDALDAVLRSLAAQRDRRFEIVVADDGSGPATAALIERWQPRLGVPLAHVWQEHRGFRAAEMRNRALLAARGDYCVFLDGDCIVRPDFVAQHRRLAERGWFVTGNRVLLSEQQTDAVLREGLAAGNAGASRTGWRGGAHGGVNRLAALLNLPLGPLRKLRSAQSGRARAPAISRSGAPISTRSTASTRASTAGAARTPICWCGCCTPACGARTAASPPASFISGIRPPTARN